MSINFGLPSEACRKQIVGQYAQQLSQADLEQLAAVTHGLSGRDLRDLCEQTERRWASRIIRGEVGDEDLPKLGDYLTSAKERQGAAQ
jgi:SpoVK/Ycf46/Vps4 family AAA+-type ATPase